MHVKQSKERGSEVALSGVPFKALDLVGTANDGRSKHLRRAAGQYCRQDHPGG